jgi:hypothetical protein
MPANSQQNKGEQNVTHPIENNVPRHSNDVCFVEYDTVYKTYILPFFGCSMPVQFRQQDRISSVTLLAHPFGSARRQNTM